MSSTTTLNSFPLFGQAIPALPGGAAQGAEVVIHDPVRQIFIVMGAQGLDFLDAVSGARVGGFGRAAVQGTGGDPLTRLGTANSVAISGDTLAIAFDGGLSGGAGSTAQVNGFVAFFQLGTAANGAVTATWQRTVTGPDFSVPDMITFTPDGTRLLVAIEGEPRDEYAAAGTSNPVGGIGIIDVATGALTFAGFEAFNSQKAALQAAGVRMNIPGATVAEDLEPEYITIAPGGAFAYVALQEANAIAELDIASATITRIMPLGFKDHSVAGNGLDPSDRDNAAGTGNIQQIVLAPVRGLYMPDGVASFGLGGRTFLVTANEGDAREWAIMGAGGRDDPRLNGSGLTLDPTVFPDATTLLLNSELGRLRVSRTDGDTDGDGDLDQIFAFGARSLSIFEVTAGGLVRTFDSGDLIERTLFTQFPTLAAADRDPAKGPEPESVSLGFIDGQLFAFLALERAAPGNSLVMAFKIEDEATVTYAGLLRGTGTGAQNPEVIAFVPRENSPAAIDAPMLAVPNESSNVFRVSTVTQASTAPFTLQILHASDFEGGVDAVRRAPNFAAIVDFLEDQSPSGNSITLSSGDNFIPGPFTAAGTDPAVRPALAAFYEQALGLAAGSLTGIRNGTLPFNALDIAILNAIGIEASVIGNHEFDLGPNPFAGAFDFVASLPALPGQPTLGSITNIGAQFPFLSANLNPAGEPALNPLFTAELRAAVSYATTRADLLTGEAIRAEATGREWSPWTTITEGGQTIGVLGITTQILAQISSVGGVIVQGGPADNMPALAAILQPLVNQMRDAGINKILLLSHLQQNINERTLAELLSGVDVIVAGGSHQLWADGTDPLEPGTTPGNTYPVVRTGADGAPVLVVNTAANYTNVGRLVVTFDANGVIDLASLDPAINGSYETSDAGVDRLLGNNDGTLSAAERATIFADGTRGGEVLQLVTPVGEVIQVKDANTFGFTNVFLEGRRGEVRTEETNLGNLTADANLFVARQVDAGVMVSIKNGGGIRAEIGAVSGQPVPVELPPLANPETGKLGGAVSQLDIENSLRFNNSLTVLSMTAANVERIVEHAVAAWTPTTTPGQFGQFGGLAFSFDPTRAAQVITQVSSGGVPVSASITTEGLRVRNLVVTNDLGNPVDVLVRDGVFQGDPNRVIKVVTLNFLAGNGTPGQRFLGGDSYPFPLFTIPGSRVDLLNSPLLGDGGATFAARGSEQDALAEFLLARHGTAAAAFDIADTTPAGDLRIQNLGFRADTVGNPFVQVGGPGGAASSVQTVRLPEGGAQSFALAGTNADETFFVPDGNIQLDAGGGNDIVFGGAGNDLLRGNDGDDEIHGGGGNDVLGGGGGNDFIDGGEGDDQLFGDAGADVLSGGAGNDVLYGGAGGDLMMGGLGDDSYQIDNLGDVVEETAGEGTDSVFVLIDGWTAATGTEATYLMGTATLLFGSAGADVLVANAGNLGSRLFGNAGGDQLWGAEGDDELWGGAGRDVIRGGGGADVLVGGEGNDQLVGGAGADRFVFNAAGWGRDEVFDFSRAEGDLIDMRGSGYAFADLAISVIGTTTRVEVQGDRMDFYNVPGGLAAADFLFA